MSDKYSGDLDPQIANLIGLTNEDNKAPDFDTLFQDDHVESPDLTVKKFKLCTTFQGKPHPAFADKEFYKRVLNNEGDIAKKVHTHLTGFLNAKDPADKSMFRGRLIPAFWDLGSSIAAKIVTKLPDCKILLLRYGLISPAFLSPEQQDLISRLIFRNETEEPVYYVDEWLIRIARGLEKPSATDELKKNKKDDNVKFLEKYDRTRGQKDTEIVLLRNKLDNRNALEARLQDCVHTIIDHSLGPAIDGIAGPYTDNQKKMMLQIGDLLRKMSATDKEINRSFSNIQTLNQSLETLDKHSDDSLDSDVDASVVANEFNNIRQMAKLCVGRKGNHFPILMKNYFRASIRDLGIRENVINEMAYVESLDPGLFFRTFRNQTTRIIPNIILLPGYGEIGICWEPFERHNRASSRGRIAIPLFPKNLRSTVIAACADLRWQVAKEKAQHYWMEEGITGKYYMWFQEKKMRGDVRAAFINDYILWVTRECDGVQKLDRDVRGIFWRLIPFPQEIKDKLRNRGFVYNELYKKDINISRSDGY